MKAARYAAHISLGIASGIGIAVCAASLVAGLAIVIVTVRMHQVIDPEG